MLGFENSGKTTLLYKLKLGEVVTTIPTIGFNVETVEYKNCKMVLWDIGGQSKIRPLWRHYYTNTNALIFVIDSTAKEDFLEIKQEFSRLLSEEELKGIPFLIFANKHDLPSAVPVNLIAEAIGLNEIYDREYFIQPSCSSIINFSLFFFFLNILKIILFFSSHWRWFI